MAQEKSKSFRNSVRLVGYLKETTLEERVAENGKHFITGSVQVATDEYNVHFVNFFVFEEDNQEKYDAIKKYLPQNTISVASYLKTTDNKANFATAAGMAAKVWVMAAFEENTRRSGERETARVNLKGFSIGTCDPNKTFTPTSEFEVDGYIEEIEPEKVDEEETGRLNVKLLIPGYKGIMHRVPFVVGTEDNAAKGFAKKYKVSDTARLKGVLTTMVIRKDNEETESYFGREEPRQVTTTFRRERIITVGPTAPISQGAEGCITTEAVKEGLAKREVAIDERSKRRAKAVADKESDKEEPAEKPAPVNQKLETAPAQDNSSTNPEDLDF